MSRVVYERNCETFVQTSSEYYENAEWNKKKLKVSEKIEKLIKNCIKSLILLWKIVKELWIIWGY